MTALEALKILNALLMVGKNALPIARKWGQTMQRAQEQGRAINEDEWKAAIDAADQADSRLARIIREKAVE